MKKFLFIVLTGIALNASATPLSELVVDVNTPIIIGDKTMGKLYVYTPMTHSLIQSPALYGAKIADSDPLANFDTGKNIDKVTPSGTFNGQKFISARLNEPVFAFVLGKASMIAIHPVYLGLPEQKRIDRLNSPNPADHRITNGCVNVPTSFYYNVLDKLQNNTPIVMLKEGDTLVNNVGQPTAQDEQAISLKYGQVDVGGKTGFAGLD